MKPNISLRFIVAFIFSTFLCQYSSNICYGVIIAGPDGTINTTAPGDDPGFANVLRIGSSSGVYLGNGWVLTANHVGVNSFTFDSVTYSPVFGTDLILQNPSGSGLSLEADLVLYQVDGLPSLPSIEISATAPAVSADVVMIGGGKNRLPVPATEVFWDVDNSWAEFSSSTTDTDTSGWKWDSSKSFRWGNNEVANDTIFGGTQGIDSNHSVVIQINGRDTVTLVTTFDSDGFADEAQAATSDSGGGVFYKNGSQWELAGLMHAITFVETLPSNSWPNRPGSLNAAAFGDVTFFTDLSIYRDQINAHIVPEPSAWMMMVIALSICLCFAARGTQPVILAWIKHLSGRISLW